MAVRFAMFHLRLKNESADSLCRTNSSTMVGQSSQRGGEGGGWRHTGLAGGLAATPPRAVPPPPSPPAGPRAPMPRALPRWHRRPGQRLGRTQHRAVPPPRCDNLWYERAPPHGPSKGWGRHASGNGGAVVGGGRWWWRPIICGRRGMPSAGNGAGLVRRPTQGEGAGTRLAAPTHSAQILYQRDEKSTF